MKTKINDGVATLMKAAMEGDTAQAQQMIRDGADVNARDDSGRTALMIAASNGHTYIVQLLLDSGADPAARDKQNMTALLSAEAKGFARTASLLKDSTPNGAQTAAVISPTDERAAALQKSLQHAADKGDTKRIKALIAEGAPLNTRTENNWTPLMLATIKGHTETVQTLIEKGAEINAQNNKGWTALMFAVSMSDVETMRLLLTKRADANVTDNEGKTALMQAASENNLDSVRVLLDHKANVNVADRTSETALTIAARRNYTQIVELLQKAAENGDSSSQTSAPSGFGSSDETHISTEALFNESELQRLKEEIEGYLPQTWLNTERVESSVPIPSQALVPSEFSHFGERLLTVIESLRQNSFAPIAPSPAPVSIADIAHKLLLTLPEAAALSNLSRAHLRRAIHGESLKAKKLGRGWRIKRADLNVYVSEL